MNWIERNFKTIIYIAFLVPILTVAFVSISHVTTWYGLSNPLTWAIYLSVGIEIAALSALAAISAQMGKKVYVPFGIVTLIQFIGNIFFAYQFIDVTSEQFLDWVELVDPVVSFLGVESGNMISHKRFLALFSGGMLPIISLSFLHMLVKFEEEGKKTKSKEKIDLDELSKIVGKEELHNVENKFVPTEEDLKKLEEELIKLNEKKFGNLSNELDEKITIELEKEQDTNEILQTDSVNVEDIVEIEPVQIENVNTEENETYQSEPDFYSEPEPDLIIDDEKSENNENKLKRLVYTRSH